jgi:hypothetical protein
MDINKETTTQDRNYTTTKDRNYRNDILRSVAGYEC